MWCDVDDSLNGGMSKNVALICQRFTNQNAISSAK